MKKDKKNSFNTPEGYFENFHDRLMDKINQEKIEEASDVIPKTDGFSIPEGYFEGFNEKISSKIRETERGKLVQLNPYRKLFYAAAAVAAIFLLVFTPIWKSDAAIAFEDLASAEIENYLNISELDMSSYEIAEMVSLEDIELNDVLEDDIEDENILEYLDENVEDIEELNLDYSDYE
ncbi:hypothetical protein GTQ34_01575 [Muricauda sp. JGD-17]|uniref:Uncharacterized protein n=1 Tax=Flagellimonas ochracea TaxID=2696472 RepID=A0A964WW46_9FLAO|nr:hypothetical protein [Allomuricauda ochracea]NAY90595.1 hypothetical protein [Allomuricauda ochracea]